MLLSKCCAAHMQCCAAHIQCCAAHMQCCAAHMQCCATHMQCCAAHMQCYAAHMWHCVFVLFLYLFLFYSSNCLLFQKNCWHLLNTFICLLKFPEQMFKYSPSFSPSYLFIFLHKQIMAISSFCPQIYVSLFPCLHHYFFEECLLACQSSYSLLQTDISDPLYLHLVPFAVFTHSLICNFLAAKQALHIEISLAQNQLSVKFPGIQGHAETYRDMQKHSGTFGGMQGHAEIQGNKEKCRGIQNNIGEYRIKRETKG